MKAGEEEEARKLGQERLEAKGAAFDLLRALVRGDLDLKVAGHRDLEQAARWIVESTGKKLQKLEAEFLRKYPD